MEMKQIHINAIILEVTDLKSIVFVKAWCVIYVRYIKESRLTFKKGNDMVTETNEYKGRQFICDSCGYVVSSNAMSDFDVDDFNYCPCCGEPNECADL